MVQDFQTRILQIRIQTRNQIHTLHYMMMQFGSTHEYLESHTKTKSLQSTFFIS